IVEVDSEAMSTRPAINHQASIVRRRRRRRMTKKTTSCACMHRNTCGLLKETYHEDSMLQQHRLPLPRAAASSSLWDPVHGQYVPILRLHLQGTQRASTTDAMPAFDHQSTPHLCALGYLIFSALVTLRAHHGGAHPVIRSLEALQQLPLSVSSGQLALEAQGEDEGDDEKPTTESHVGGKRSG
ncbi:hypothetical protein BHE74_00035022, partial [Ensete ventricosum]